MGNIVKIAPQSNALDFPDEKKALIKKTYGKDLTDLEFDLFISVASARGLDPVMNQIHAVKRNDKNAGEKSMTIQVGIDGFRVTASRSGAYAGRDETVFEYNGSALKKAKVTVYKIVQGMRVPFTETASWSEYFPTNEKQNFMWKKMPETMLSKCAEAKALRAAFPSDLSGIYIPEEIQQERGNHVVEEKVIEANKRFEEPKAVEVIEANSDAPKKLAVQTSYGERDKQQRLKTLGFKWDKELKLWTHEDVTVGNEIKDLEPFLV